MSSQNEKAENVEALVTVTDDAATAAPSLQVSDQNGNSNALVNDEPINSDGTTKPTKTNESEKNEETKKDDLGVSKDDSVQNDSSKADENTNEKVTKEKDADISKNHVADQIGDTVENFVAENVHQVSTNDHETSTNGVAKARKREADNEDNVDELPKKVRSEQVEPEAQTVA